MMKMFKKPRLSFQLSLLIACCFLSPLALRAQQSIPMHMASYHWKASAQSRTTADQPLRHIVKVDGATWLRLYFDDVNLGEDSYIKITSLKDGATQILDAEKMAFWENTSAYFNGDQVEVIIHDKSGKNGQVDLSITQLEVGEPSPVGTLSQCGSTDNRVASSDAAVGRLVPVGCTGWIIRNGKMVTAGHCVGSRMKVLEFNVPRSNSDGSIVHPGPEDQYKVTNVVEGTSDWAVFETFANSETGKSAINAQGRSFNVVQVGSVGSVRITGYGVDTGRDNQTLQTHVGPSVGVTDTRISYQTDTEGGNSGSPVIDEATGNAIGVHTNGGCSTSGGGSNFGTSAKVSAFWNAMGLSGGPGPGPGYCAAKGNSDYEYIRKVSIGSFSNESGGAPYTDFTGKTISASPGSNLSVTLTPGFPGSSYSEYWKIWIDFNKDGDFTDSGEEVFSGSGSSTVTGTLSISSYASGKTRMRVIMKYGSAPSSCGDFSYGEVEDYSINMGSYASGSTETVRSAGTDMEEGRAMSIYPNPNQGEFNVDLGGLGSYESVSLRDLSGNLQDIEVTASTEGQLHIGAGKLAKGTYILILKTESEVVHQKIIVE